MTATAIPVKPGESRPYLRLDPRRAMTDRAQASSIYLCLYYLGSSVLGTAAPTYWNTWDSVTRSMS